MSLNLSDRNRSLAKGLEGPAARIAMSIPLRMAEVYRAREMFDITQAHVDSSIRVGDAGLEIADRLARRG